MQQQQQRQTPLVLGVFRIIGSSSSVVLVWYGLWGILDLYLFPHDEELSAISSILIAVLLTIVSYIICPSSSLLLRSSSTTSTLVKKLLSLLSVFNTALLGVCYWRGIWKSWHLFVLKNHSVVARYSIAVIVGVLTLIVTSNWKHDIVGPPLFFPEIIQQQQQLSSSSSSNGQRQQQQKENRNEQSEGTVSIEETDNDDGSQMISMTVINSNER